MTSIRRYFPGGNTSSGFFSYHNNIIDSDRNMLYILKGMPGGGKSSMMKEIGDRAVREGYGVELHHCPSDPDSIDGVVIEELKIAVVDGTAPHIIDPVYPGLTEKIIDLGVYINGDVLKLYRDEIISAKKANKEAYRRAFNYFKSSKMIYEEIESNNMDNVDFEGIDRLTKNAIERIFSKENKKKEISGFKNRHIFTAAYTPIGLVDYTTTVIDGRKERFFLKGNIGTGKTRFLKRVSLEAGLIGYHIEMIHNPLVPSKLDGLYIKELDTIISTNDDIKNYIFTTIDLDDYFDEESINHEDYRIMDILIRKGIDGLGKAIENHGILEGIYKKSIDYKGVTEVKNRLFHQIFEG